MLAAEGQDKKILLDPVEPGQLLDALRDARGIAVALSGGSDSMALLHLLLAWQRQRDNGARVVALTVDHGLRAGSAGEARQVAEHCRRIGVEHHILHWLGEKPQSGVQAKARKARYGLLTAWCKRQGVSHLLTAHTADDQAETVVMRAKRTTSAESLSGIWPEVMMDGVCVVRPLLNARRAALRTYLKSRGVAWMDDPSNEDPRFERVQVRRALDGADVEGLAARAALAQQQAGETSLAAKTWFHQELRWEVPYALSLPRQPFAELPLDVQVQVARLVITRLRGGARAERAGVERLCHWLSGPQGNRRTLGGVQFAKRKNLVLAGREAARIAPSWQEVPASGVLAWDNRFVVRAPPGTRIGPARLVSGLKGPKGMPGWLAQGLPVARTGQGLCFHIVGLTQSGRSTEDRGRPDGVEKVVQEQLGIVASATYVNEKDGFRVV